MKNDDTQWIFFVFFCSPNFFIYYSDNVQCSSEYYRRLETSSKSKLFIQRSVRRFENKFIFDKECIKETINPELSAFCMFSESRIKQYWLLLLRCIESPNLQIFCFTFVLRSESNNTKKYLILVSNSQTLAHQWSASLLSWNFWCVIAFKLFYSFNNWKMVQVL